MEKPSSRARPWHFPFETLRHWYVTPFGGRSSELHYHQIGIRREALEKNTNLEPDQDQVTVSLVGENKSRPLFMYKSFEVVALDEARPQALGLSPQGEAVLPADEYAEVRKPVLDLQHGDYLLLNRLAGLIFQDRKRQWYFELVVREVMRRDRDVPRT